MNSAASFPIRHKCEYCNKNFSRKSHLDLHRKIHTGQKDFHCNFCSYASINKQQLANHMRTHTKEKPYKCQHPGCTAAFARNSHFWEHQKVHKEYDESLPTFHCPVPDCPYKSNRRSSRAAHLKTHAGEKAFPCMLCPYRGNTARLVRQHHQSVHSSERPFKCPEPNCTYSTKQKGHLTDHLKIHTDERPFPCPFPGCSQRSRTRADLTMHQRVHSGEKPFKCTFCLFSCTQRNILVNHTRVHTGETPYHCQQCPIKCKTSGQLRNHVNSCHLGIKKRRANNK